MAEKLCTLRTKGGGGGGKQTETVLWTNSAPTSNFADQNVTLSDSMSNYDYLKFTYKKATNNATSTSAVFSVSDVKNFADESVYGQLGGESATDWYMSRYIWYISDTSVRISTAWKLNSVGNNNAYIIPLAIIGIKNMGGNGAINLSGFTFQFKAHTNNASGNNRTYINLPVGHINSFRITGTSGSYSAMRFGWKGDNSATTDVVLNTVYTKPSDATELAIWVAVLNSTCTVTMEIID